MKKLTYFVRLERRSQIFGAPFGISVRSPDGELNTFFVCDSGENPLKIPAGLFQHLRDLQAMFNAAVQWDYESFLEAGLKSASHGLQENA